LIPPKADVPPDEEIGQKEGFFKGLLEGTNSS